MVKELKKDRHVNSQIKKNDDEDASTWTCDCCGSCLKSHKAITEGYKSKSHTRCML